MISSNSKLSLKRKVKKIQCFEAQVFFENVPPRSKKKQRNRHHSFFLSEQLSIKLWIDLDQLVISWHYFFMLPNKWWNFKWKIFRIYKPAFSCTAVERILSHGTITPRSMTRKLLQPSTTPTMFLPISCTSPFTVASTIVPANLDWKKIIKTYYLVNYNIDDGEFIERVLMSTHIKRRSSTSVIVRKICFWLCVNFLFMKAFSNHCNQKYNYSTSPVLM